MTLPNLWTDRGVRTLAKICLGLLMVIALAWVALLAALRFVVIPNVEGFRPKLVDYLAKSTGRAVAIGGLSASWDGWNPRFVLHELTLKDANGAVALRLPRVEQTLSYRSLLSFDLNANRLVVDGLRVVIRRDAQNRISVAGMDLPAPRPDAEPDSRAADWLLDQRSVSVRDAEVVWQDDFRNAPPIALNQVNARLVNSGNRHRLGLTANWSDTVASPIQVVADLNGETAAKLDQWSGKTYVRLDTVDIARLKQWLTLPFPVEAGQGGVQIWAGLDRGLPNEVTADVRLANVKAKLQDASAPLQVAQMQGRLAWTQASGKTVLTRVSAENLALTFADKSLVGPLNFKGLLRRTAQGAFEKSEIEIDGFALDGLNRLLPTLPIPEAFAKPLVALNLKGKIGKTTYEWDGEPTAPQRYALQTSFDGLGFSNLEAIPGLTNVKGAIKLSQVGGEIAVTGNEVTVTMPTVFAAPIKLDTLKTGAQWSRSEKAISVRISDTTIANDDVSATLSGSYLHTPGAALPGVADFAGVIDRAKADRVWAYLPTVIDSGVREYVKNAFEGGRINRGDFVLRGALDKFPFPNDKDGQWRISVQASGVNMDYADRWPKATDADLTLTFAGQRMTAEVGSAKMSGIPLKNVRASIADLRVNSPQLSIIGTAAGPTRDFLRFVETSPVSGWINRFTDGMRAEGEGNLSLAFEVPLGDRNARSAVRGEYEFRGNTLNLGGEIPVIADMRGKLLFTEESATSQSLQGRVLGGPASFVVQNVPGGIKVSASGQADVTTLLATYPIPYLDRASGATDWALEVDTPSGGAFTVTSSLRGVKVDAPAPLGKTADATTPLVVTRKPLTDKRDDISVAYGETIRARVRLAAANAVGSPRAPEAMNIVVSNAKSPTELSLAQPFALVVNQADINLDPWLDMLNTQPASSLPANRATKNTPAEIPSLAGAEIRMSAERITARGVRLNQASVNLKPEGKQWVVNVKSREADGSLVWTPGEQTSNGAVQARFTKLVVAEKSTATAVSTPTDPIAQVTNAKRDSSNWPSLDVVADSFTLRGNAMGRLEMKAAPLGEHWRIEQLTVSNPDAEFRADGVWTRGEPEPQTILSAELKIADTQKYFARLGLGEGIREAKGTIAGKLGWIGSPLDFENRGLNGEFTIELGQGRFTNAEPGIAKLLGVISLQSLARRIVFDTRDLFKEGFSFDKASAVVALKNGILTTENLDIFGPTARVEIRGTVNLIAETQDLNVRVLPDMTTSAAIAAGVITANPLVAAGAFLASKVIKDPLDRVFSMKMKVSGTWADPKVDRVDRLARDEEPAATGPG
jgi:uncharacterized protein (TIGR02099 family)